jgi:hypothetical protein
MLKPNFDTHAAYQSLVNSGLPPNQAEQILEVLKDSQAELSTKTDLSVFYKSLVEKIEQAAHEDASNFKIVSLQIKALFVMLAGKL